MKILPRQFRPSEYQYYSDKSVDTVTKQLNNIFSKKTFDLSVNFSGSFTNEREFVATRKYNFLVSSIPFDFAIIYGKISLADNNKTHIDMTVIQNKTITFLFVLSILIGLLCLTASIIRPNKPNWLEVLICGLVFTFIVPFILSILGQLNKKLFIGSFADLLKFKPTEKNSQ